MATFHLRPVSDNSPSPSPSASTTPPGDHSPASFKGRPGMLPSPTSNAAAGGRGVRRPLSPSSLRDVDLTPHSSDPPLRKYPAPPTGHDLMAMFPPPPPDLFPEMRPGPTSGFFQRQERAFFAQAGKEIVRVRVEVDISDLDPASSAKMRAPAREQSAPPRPWPQQQLHPAPTASASSGPGAPGPNSHASPSQSSSSLPYPPQNMRSGRQNVPMTSTPLFPSPHSQHSQPPPNLHPPPTLHHPTLGLRTPGQENGPNATPKQEFPSEEYREDPDEAWRRPMPYAERRRAGKHTRRVIVKN
ncbi:hypothetical protein PC9H_011434 [Pleurotus ostreatus]|uniref:Uncharacterized protein n=2 Tax=Pleurotus ostreatus TaxID=5322 RepID=A0A067NAK1_PLEO1|nr:uncharacterized protein PC9H_011434 [Pleurotus ostreatus]KAF7420915.1 hypothetical protein PC9H_011434 [Pleurotus ostreatus]KAJ8690380.1 hypothetical protein PTI98_011808 [Pleurotus ostreatus]KDQ23985.1 hypothetical protein PLEOSDRAFT_1090636 [Pleurotus ostreatus PC15]